MGGRSVIVRSAGERVGDVLTVYLGEKRLCEHRRHAKGAVPAQL